MDKDIYEHGQPPYGPPLSPEFCLGHWQTQCRATFEAPMDPSLILGGFPSGPDFRNYSADATAFVVTYPVDSSEDNRCCAARCLEFMQRRPPPCCAILDNRVSTSVRTAGSQ